MSALFDIAIIGAGPAGLSAAVVARLHGLTVVVFDQQSAPGGQIFRAVETVARERHERMEILGSDYAEGLAAIQRFRSSGADYRPLTSVWRVDHDGTVYFSDGQGATSLKARTVLVATGAIERPMPIPGWTLPGVIGCGGAQVLLKAADLVPSGRAFLAGSGPLLFLYASQLLRAGVRLAGILETTPTANYARAAIRLPQALGAHNYLLKGLQMTRDLKRAGIPILRNVTELRAVGDHRLRHIEFQRRGRACKELADTMMLHQGVVPNVNLIASLGCDKQWDLLQRCYAPNLSEIGETSVANIFVAGDGAGIGGAKAAEYSGALCAIAIGERLGRIAHVDSTRHATKLRTERSKHLRIRPFLDTLYRPTQASVAPRDPATIVCRCEEVTAGDIRKLVAQGCVGPNQMKAFVRCGMGPCQGRFCGLTVVEMIAEQRGVPVEEVGYYRIRSPVTPITLGELAGIQFPSVPK